MLENKSKVYKMALCSLFAALIIVGAYIKIPMPIVPKTLQFFFVVLAATFLGKKWGTISVLIYILLGLAGVPVFAGGGGISYVLTPTFGYIIAFILGVFVEGLFLEKNGKYTFKYILAGNIINMIIVYVIGVAYCYLISKFVLGTPLAFWPLMVNGFFILVPGDVVLLIIAAYLGKRVISAVR